MSNAYIGEIRMWSGPRIPRGWMACEGQPLSIDEHSVLHGLIGTTYGGDNSGVFNLPDLRGRIPVSLGQAPGQDMYTLGVPGGSEMVSLSPGQLGLHTHGVFASASAADSTQPDPTRMVATAAANVRPYVDTAKPTGAVATFSPEIIGDGPGQGVPHDNMMPTAVVRYMICVDGIYPNS